MTDIKSILLVASFSIICGVFVTAQDNTLYPEGYLNEATRVDMAKAPDVFITKNGERTVTTVVDGRKWNRAWYWEEVRKRAPQMFDKSNNYAIDRGFSPTANQAFIEHNPQFINFKGEKLHHHHFKRGNIAYALPERLHVGKGYTKLWHRLAKKPLILVGAAFSIYEIGIMSNPFAESPFGLWIEQEFDELELSNIELAISQGYDAIKRYIEDCRSCSDLGMFYCDYGEIMYFIGTGRLPEDYHFATFQERLPRNGNEAALFLNKAIEFCIILRRKQGEFQGIGIIDLPRYEE